MRHLLSLSGTGHVRIGEESVGSVSYTIDAFEIEIGGLKNGRGSVEAESAILHKIMNSRVTPTLELETGGTVDFLITNWNVASGIAHIATSGPIPGA